MHKIIAILFFMGLMLQNSYAAGYLSIQNDSINPNHINGGFKEGKIYLTVYNDKHGKLKKSPKKFVQLKRFDDRGNKIEETGYDDKGEIISNDIHKFKYEYDEKGNIIEYIIYKNDGKIDYKRTFKYNELGKKIEECYHDAKSYIYQKEIDKYDTVGKKIEEIIYRPENKFDSRKIFIHNLNNKLIESIRYGKDSSIESKNNYKYDDKGNKIEVIDILYDSDGAKYRQKGIYKYNDKGKVIEHIGYDSKNAIYHRETYKYNSKGTINELTIFRKDSPDKKIEFKYDDNGNEIETIYYSRHDRSFGKLQTVYSK